MKHIVQTESGRFRRLVPDELDQLQGFPKGWTDTGMSDLNRAFCMGNALVVGIPRRIGQVLQKRIKSERQTASHEQVDARKQAQGYETGITSTPVLA
jgi:hypothetical protein